MAKKGTVLMRTRNFIGACLLLLLLINAQAQQELRYVLLPPSESNTLADRYPRKGPDRIDGIWQPTTSQIKALESNLQNISSLRSDDAPNGQQIDHPARYFRQYVAVIQGGEPLIYINSLCNVHANPDWRHHLVSAFGGGNCYWQAWYDPATATYFDLTINRPA